MVSGVYRRVSRLPTSHPLRRSWRYLRRIAWVRQATDRLLQIWPGILIPATAAIPGVPTVSRRHPYLSLLNTKTYFGELLQRASSAAPINEAVPRRVLLVNAGLAAGGLSDKSSIRSMVFIADRSKALPLWVNTFSSPPSAPFCYRR